VPVADVLPVVRAVLDARPAVPVSG
jgi:hypothetical protein